MADNDKHVIDLWQQQTSEGFRLTAEQIQMSLQKLEARVRSRTRDIYLATAFTTVGFGVWAFVTHDLLTRIGAIMLIVAGNFLLLQVHRNRIRRSHDPQMAVPSLEHLRNELQRQMDFHRGKQLWSRLLVMFPAGLFFFSAFAHAHPELMIIRFELVSFVLILIAAIPLNLRLARKYQRQIEELDRQKELV